MRLADEMLDHLLGDFEVGDDSGAQRSDGLNIFGRLAHHQLGVVADRPHLADSVFDFHRNDGRLAGDDSGAPDIDDSVGGTEVDRDVSRREIEQ